MGFSKKEWIDRLVEYAGRRKLTNIVTGVEEVVDVARHEGAVSQEGDAFSAENMNGLEERIYSTFDEVTKVYENTVVEAESWSTYDAELTGESDIVGEYPYMVDIALDGITEAHCAKVNFLPTDLADGVFSPYNNTQDGVLRIYANALPIEAITIPTIYALKKGV